MTLESLSEDDRLSDAERAAIRWAMGQMALQDEVERHGRPAEAVRHLHS